MNHSEKRMLFMSDFSVELKASNLSSWPVMSVDHAVNIIRRRGIAVSKSIDVTGTSAETQAVCSFSLLELNLAIMWSSTAVMN